MIKPTISILTAILIVQFLFITPVFGQHLTVENETAKIKTFLMNSGTGEKSKVKVKLRDGREIKGYVAELNADNFVIVNSKDSSRTTVNYNEAAHVKKSGLSLGAKIGIAALAVGAVAAIVIVAGVKNLDDNVFPN